MTLSLKCPKCKNIFTKPFAKHTKRKTRCPYCGHVFRQAKKDMLSMVKNKRMIVWNI